MFGALKRGLRTVATGGTQRSLGLQSPHLPGAVIRTGRFAYSTSAIWITVSWYVGYANARTTPGGGPKVVLPGAKVVAPVDRSTANKTPAAFSGNVGSSIQAGAMGGSTRLAVARLALSMVSKPGFVYDPVRPMPRSIMTRPFKSDCSGFFTDLYKAVGAADPNGLNYNGQGDTDTLQQHGMIVSTPNIGDAAFWENPDHVAIVVGTGQNPPIVEFGGPSTPIKSTMRNELGFHSRFIGYRSYL